MANNKYIKVTDKNGKSTIVLSSNEAFAKNQGFKISEPTQEEVQQYFPNEKGKTVNKQNVNSSSEKELEKAQKALEKEKSEHEKTKQQIDKLKSEHAAQVEKLQAEIDKLKKKE